MSTSRLFTDVSLDRDEKLIVARSWQDCDAILEENKEARSERQTGDFRRVAQIPNGILVQWLNEEWARGNLTLRLHGKEMDELIARKLKDPDWQHLRTDAGGTKWR
jgi:hypothetical protein